MEDLDQKKVEELPFSEPKQDAILGHLLRDEKFFKYACNKLQPHWFMNAYNSKIFRAKLAFTQEHGCSPTVQELQESPGFMQEQQGERNLMLQRLILAEQQAENYKLEPLKKELTAWFKCRIYHEGVERSVKIFNSGRFEEAANALNETVKKYMDVSFDDSSRIDLTDMNFLNRSVEDRRGALTFGLKEFDKRLLPDNEEGKGSLLPGDSTVLIGPNNAGKTTVMITVMRHNIQAGKSVLYIPLEGRPSDLLEKIWCSMLDVNKVELLNLHKTDMGLFRMQRLAETIRKQLVMVPMVKAGLTVEDVVQVIRKNQQEREALEGKGFDLVVIDYPAKLTTRQADGGHMQRRHIDAYVYNQFVQLALENNYHSLVAIQVNREGSKINKGLKGYEERLLIPEDVMEAWEVTCTATNIVTLNRSPQMMARGIITFYICKSRSSETGWAIAAKSNYPHAITHWDDLGATAYFGTASHADRIGDLLVQYQGKEIPTEVLRQPIG